MADHSIDVSFNTSCEIVCANKAIKDPKGSQVTIKWNAAGTGVTFPATNFFSWKPGKEGPPGIERKSDTKLELTYTMPTSAVVWSYTISLTSDACGTKLLDPDIDNDPPGGGEEIIPPKNPPGQQGPDGPTGGGNVGGGSTGGGNTGGGNTGGGNTGGGNTGGGNAGGDPTPPANAD